MLCSRCGHTSTPLHCVREAPNQYEHMRLRCYTLHVSQPIPVFPPVTQTILPVRSGIFSAVQCGLPGKSSFNHLIKLGMLSIVLKLRGGDMDCYKVVLRFIHEQFWIQRDFNRSCVGNLYLTFSMRQGGFKRKTSANQDGDAVRVPKLADALSSAASTNLE